MCNYLWLQNSVINLSEESQLEAAIKASLQEVCPQATERQTIVFSDDSDVDYISVSPDGETDSQETISTLPGAKTIGQPSQAPGGIDGDDRTKDSADPASSYNYDYKTHIKSRKRLSSNNEGDQDCPRKKAHTDVDPMCVAIDNMELTQLVPSEGLVLKHSVDNRIFNGKGRKGKKGKGKGKAKAEETDPVSRENYVDTVEELLASGDIHKDEVSQILFRLPDGTRLQKCFLSKHPISVSVCLGSIQQVLYTFFVMFRPC